MAHVAEKEGLGAVKLSKRLGSFALVFKGSGIGHAAGNLFSH